MKILSPEEWLKEQGYEHQYPEEVGKMQQYAEYYHKQMTEQPKENEKELCECDELPSPDKNFHCKKCKKLIF
jgi:hypothetical protein